MQAIGKYTVLGEIARGGAGVVYRGRDPHIQRDVAIKVLTSQGGEHARKRFQREATALGSLRHPGIVPLYDMGEQAGLPYLVMPLIDGETLADRLECDGPLPECEAAELIHAVALALQHAHDQGLLHRDVKPDNVLLDAANRPLLTDFGLVKDLGASLSRTQLTVEGRFMGTPGFWSPEQARGEIERIGVRTDVYGLGATLYALLTGAPPHTAQTLVDFLAAAERMPEPPSRSRPNLNPQLDRICLKCVALDPEDRYPSAQALAGDLERFLAGDKVTANVPRSPRRSRRPLILLVGLLGLVLALGLAVVSVVRSATQERLDRAEALLTSQPLGETIAALKATRLRLAEARTLVDGEPVWVERIQAIGLRVQLWERLIATRAVSDLHARSVELEQIRRAAGADIHPSLARALDGDIVIVFRRVLELLDRPPLTLPDPRQSQRLSKVVDLLTRAIARPSPSDATRLAARARVLARVEDLVARSRTDVPFDPLLSELTDVLDRIPPDRASLASRVRLELGQMHARGGRFARAIQVLTPLFKARGPDARCARAQALILSPMCDAPLDLNDLAERISSENVEDPWRHVEGQRRGIQTRNAKLKEEAEEALIKRYPKFWLSALTQGDLAMARRDSKTFESAYDRAAVLSPRDARVWWWKAATFATALQYAGLGVMSKEQVTKLRASHARCLRLLKQVRPLDAPLLDPNWRRTR